MNTKSWERVTATLVFVIRNRSGIPKVLLGQIRSGLIMGFLTPPGGKVEKSDRNIKEAAKRELLEETRLKAREMHEVAKVKIKILSERRTVILHVFVCKSFSGVLRRLEREFTYLKWFPVNRVPYDIMASGDEDWVKRVLRGERLSVNLLCGRDRLDLMEIHIEILP